MKDRLSWGILGTGNIARQFAEGVGGSHRCRLAAVGSRSETTARTFAQAHGIPAAHGSYDALLEDPAVDAVYVSLPNTMHHEWTIRALRAGRHVLCEKPFAPTAAEAEEMFDVAEQAGRVLVEAFMYRSHPLTHAVHEAVRSGAIGELRLIRTSFCYRTRTIDGNIRFDPALAGGALMDIGCYCIDFSRLFAGEEPKRISGTARTHRGGVDEIAAGTLHFPGGVVASFTCGMTLQADNTAALCGSEGYIEVPVPWKPPVSRACFRIGHSAPPRMDNPSARSAPPGPQTRYVDAGKPLYALEADDFAAAVLDGAEPRMSRRDTTGNLRVMDELRRSWA